MTPLGRLEQWGTWALVPAPIVFGVRSAIMALGGDWPTALGPLLGLVGVLSAIGMLLILIQRVQLRFEVAWSVVSILVALVGHYVLEAVSLQALGNGLVYLGTGFLVGLRVRRVSVASLPAFLGATLRDSSQLGGDLLVAVGGPILAVFLLRASRAESPTPLRGEGRGSKP